MVLAAICMSLHLHVFGKLEFMLCEDWRPCAVLTVDSSLYTGELTAQVGWLGLRVGGHLVLSRDRQNWVNFYSDDGTIVVVVRVL